MPDRTIPVPPRESELEKVFEPSFKEYEEWRARQGGAETEARPAEKKDTGKKQPFVTKMDLLFVLLGFIIAVTLGRGCAGGQ